jgi:hypothetical protein
MRTQGKPGFWLGLLSGLLLAFPLVAIFYLSYRLAAVGHQNSVGEETGARLGAECESKRGAEPIKRRIRDRGALPKRRQRGVR